MLNSKKKCNFAALFVFIQKTQLFNPKDTRKHTMVHLTNTSRSATFLLGTAILMLFLFCAPMHAQTPTFKSTSSYRIANPNYSAQQLDPTTIGHETYRSTIYTPFGNGTPSSNNPSGNSGSGGSGDPNDDVGIPGWADTPSEPLPIGDSTPLFWLAAAMIALIFIKQRRKQKQLSTQTSNNHSNNDTNEMTLTQHTRKSFRKLLMLALLLCVVGEASAKVVYFRPSTILVGPSGTAAKDATAWAKETSDCWFPMLRVSNYESSSRVKHMDQYEDNYISNAIYAGTETSRFLGYTVDSNTDGFAFYRVEDGGSHEVTTSYWTIGTNTVNAGVYDCVPNNKWWKNSQTYHHIMFNLGNISIYNLIGINEGEWGSGGYNGYYLAFYVENDVHLYFANTNNWKTPTFARGKDVYSYKENADRITGTRLYYTKLAGKSGIAYEKYAYIDDSTGSWTEIEDLWKKYKTTVATQATIDANKLDTRISSFTKRSISVQNIRLDDTSVGTTHLIIPTSTSNITDLTRTAHSSYTALNYTLTVKTYSAVKHTANASPTYNDDNNNTNGGTIEYSAYKLSSQGKSTKTTGSGSTASTDITAAYTGTVVLTAVPKAGYKFVGWYSSTGDLLSTDLKWTTEKTKGNTTIQARFMSYNKQIRMQTYGCYQDPKDNNNYKYMWREVADGGKKITIAYNDGTGNQTIEKTTAEKTEIDPQEGSTVQLSAEPKENYTFVGWWNNNGQRYDDNPWSFLPENTNQSITARFAPSRQQTVNVQTYDKEQDTYVLSGNGGSVNIAYTQLTTTVNDGYTTTNTDVTTQGTYTTLYNTSVTLTATANTNYAFLGWYEGENRVGSDATYTYTATTDRNITARFHKPFTQAFDVQTEISGQYQNSTTGGTATISYNNTTTDITDQLLTISNMEQGTMVTLNATSKTGYRFVGWYNNSNNLDSNEPKYTYRAEGSRTVHARFAPSNITLSVAVLNYNPEYDKFEEYGYEYNTITLKENSTVLKESYSSFKHKFENATTVTLTATPEEGEDGYDFVGWYINNEQLVAGTNDLYTLTAANPTELTLNLSGAVAVNAHFAPKKCWEVIIRNNIGGLFTVQYSRDANFTAYKTAESALDHYTYTYFAFGTTYVKVSPQPIHGYKLLGFKVGGVYSQPEKNNIVTYAPKYNEGDSKKSHVMTNFVREDEQIVYLNLKGSDGNIPTEWTTNDLDQYAYYAFVDNSFYTAKNNLQLKWIKMTHVQDDCYTCTIPGNMYNRISFVQIGKDAEGYFVTKKKGDLTRDRVIIDFDTIQHLGLNYVRDTLKLENRRTSLTAIPATRNNCYRLSWSWNSTTGKNEDAWTEPPTQVGDFRLVYIEQTVVDKNTIREDYRFEDAGLIKHSPDTEDTISLHIYNKVSDGVNGVNNPEIILQKCTAIVDNKSQWEAVERYMVFGPLRSNNAGVIKMPHRKNTTGEKISVDQGIGKIIAAAATDDDKACGVWNFVIVQDNAGGAKIAVDRTSRYEDNIYYIRTTNATGQYNNYTHPDNIMSTSEYAKNNSDYSHYFICDVDIYEDGTKTAEAGKHPVVKFAIANKHSVYLNNELMINNDRFTAGICKDEYEDDIFVRNIGGAPNLAADATVRFGWDIKTNRLTRAYIANTFHKNNEYLVVEGENVGEPTGEATYFNDNSNHLYSIDLENATAGARAKVKAKMNGQYQYFMGSGLQDGYETLISGNGANTYPIRLLYDFKDDRFTTIYRPDAALSGTVNLETPVMIEREHNEAPTQIKFNSGAKIQTSGTFDQPAYAVMTFLEEKLANASITHHEKMFYWISFPFDVRISDVFGLGDYGKYWIMEEYNGAQRAASGLAQNNWKYITKKSHVLEANKGYVLCLNYSQILQDQLFKSYGSQDENLTGGKLSLYFPSNSVISPEDITGGQERTVELAQYVNANTAWNHHNWHIIGVPSFANPEGVDFQYDIPFVYQYWHPSDAYAAKAYDEITFTFQAMHAYMVQYHGKIYWQNIVNTSNGSVQPMGLAAKTDEEADKKIMLRLELQQAGSTLDKTYVQLRNDKGTKGFDMSLDLTKIINAGANIYSIVNNHEMAGNAMPKEETVLPLGVVITAAGEYTFAMPQGTEGIMVELIDYEQGTCTNLLVDDYTVNMPEGTNNTRFALRLKPDKVATSVEDITSGTNDNNVRKLLIDGVLYLQQGTNTYDAQGHAIR